MPPNIHTFLFSPPGDISPSTARRIHLRRLYDVLHLSIQRGELHRARRAWAILSRCKEIDWRTSWMLATGLLDSSGCRMEENQSKVDYLRAMMLHSPEDKEAILCELVHLYVVTGRHREALDELEFCLPSFPYRDNAVLHIYAGICSALASQPGPASEIDVPSIDNQLLDRALIFFERAKSLDPENIVIDSLLFMVKAFFRDLPHSTNLCNGKTQNLSQNPMIHSQTGSSDDEAGAEPHAEADSARAKRLRT